MGGRMKPQWWEYQPVVTAALLLSSGACFEGVAKAAQTHGIVAPTELAMRLAGDQRNHVEKAANSDGYGDGDGDGDGDGSGDGYGYGYGDGDGSGYGYGDGDGSGEDIVSGGAS